MMFIIKMHVNNKQYFIQCVSNLGLRILLKGPTAPPLEDHSRINTNVSAKLFKNHIFSFWSGAVYPTSVRPLVPG